MAEMKLTVEQINQLMEKLTALKLGELSLKDGDFELKITAKQSETISMAACANPSPVGNQPVTQAMGTSVEINLPEQKKEPAGNLVKSPIVGTFYAAAAPDKPPFVTIGQKVKKGDVLFVIESMKLMNEIQSDFTGEVTEILVEDAQGVDYHQPVMVIQ